MFEDRRDAGRQLAERLSRSRLDAPVVLGLPRGGVPVAYEVARRLRAPLDVLVIRKVGCPWHRELGIGAIGEGDVVLANAGLMAQLGVSDTAFDEVAREEREELERRVAAYRGGAPPLAVDDRTAVVVDDGLATGFTARAAVDAMRRRGARHVVLAVPVAPPTTVRELEAVADEVVALLRPEAFFAIGQWYRDFSQTSDAEVRDLLAAARAVTGGGAGE